jgi:hypothetical protein
MVGAMDAPTSNMTSAPTSNSTLTEESTIWITVIVVASVVFAAGTVVFLFSSMRSGSGTEPYLFVIEKNGSNDDIDDDDPTTGYTHQLHYQ